ncbi:MAG: DUF5026 domain-containing protein [Lachnospira sp.]|jgi:hypothetical protein|nr:DUF5026 domain-containing protein [Lachnospira sp.]
MELIIEKPESVLNTLEIKTGMLVYAKHVSWKCGISGFFTAITEKEMIVQYHPRIGNVTNHFFINAKEVAAGDWQIRYSTDLSKVYEYPKPIDNTENSEDKNIDDENKNTNDTDNENDKNTNLNNENSDTNNNNMKDINTFQEMEANNDIRRTDL